MPWQRLFPNGFHQTPRRWTGLLLAACVLAALLPMAAGAAWEEGECTILPIGELRPLLEANLGVAVQIAVPDDTPVLIPRGLAPESPKALRVALLQSALALRAGGATATVVPAHRLTESERALTRLLPAAPVARGPRKGRNSLKSRNSPAMTRSCL